MLAQSMHITSGIESKGSVNMCVAVLKKRKALEISTLDDVDLDLNAQDDHSSQETHNDNHSNENTQDIIELHDNDVLSGRGNGVAAHPGNVYFRDVCVRYQQAYQESPRKKKMDIASQAALEIEKQNPPGRFLETTAEGQYYVEMSARRILEKVSQALRDRIVSPVFSSPQVSCVLSPGMSQDMVGSLFDDGNWLLAMGFVQQQLAWLEGAQRLSSSPYYEYNAARTTVSKDPSYAVASILAHDLPQGQPSPPCLENSLGENKGVVPHTSSCFDNDQFCDAPPQEQGDYNNNTSMEVFYYCVRNGYF
jgi:hypothetical protein